ncbi:hypothetical protein D3C87_1604030 [compost metagenome]
MRVVQVSLVSIQQRNQVRVNEVLGANRRHVTSIDSTRLGLCNVGQREVLNLTQPYLRLGDGVRVVLVIDVQREVATSRLSNRISHRFQNREDGFYAFEVLEVPLVVNRRELVRYIDHLFPSSDAGVQLRVGQPGKVSRRIQNPITADGLITDFDNARERLVEHRDRTIHPTSHAMRRCVEVVGAVVILTFNQQLAGRTVDCPQ